MLEEFIRSPQLLASFAHHYKTGEPIRQKLVERMNRAGAFGRANATAAQISYTAISYDIYKGNPKNVDLDAVTLADTKRYTLITPPTGTHMYASFGHLSSYSSAYYTYMWDKVIAEDFFLQFDHGNFSRGMRPCVIGAWCWSRAVDVRERPGQKLPRTSAEHDRVPALDGRRILRKRLVDPLRELSSFVRRMRCRDMDAGR